MIIQGFIVVIVMKERHNYTTSISGSIMDCGGTTTASSFPVAFFSSSVSVGWWMVADDVLLRSLLLCLSLEQRLQYSSKWVAKKCAYDSVPV